jgi:plasmid stabilization system protein ParE
VISAVESLSEYPKRGAPISYGVNSETRRLILGQVSIVYQLDVEERGIKVFTVRHHRQARVDNSS